MKAKLLGIVVCLALCFSLVGVLAPASPVDAAGPWYVATTGSDVTGNGSSGLPWRHIQYAINNAGVVSGDTINVAAGTYGEKIDISKALTLQGAGAATTIIDGTGLNAIQLVEISAAAGNVKFDGFTVRNGGIPGGAHFQVWLSGGSPGGLVTITNNIIIGVGDYSNEDYGLYSHFGLSDLVFSGNTVSNCVYEGIFFDRHKGATNIFSNTFSGIPTTAPAIGFMTYEYPADPAGSQDVTKKQWVHNNTIDARGGSGVLFMAPYAGSVYNEYKGGSFTNVEISGNTITNVGFKGIQLEVDGDGGTILNAVVSNNQLSAQTPGVGTSRGIRLLGGTTNTTITGNTISGFYRGVYQSYSFGVPGTTGPTGTVLHDNIFSGNWYYGLENQYTAPANVIDATHNWWGDVSGPSVVGYGSGDGVSANVVYEPWHSAGFVANTYTGRETLTSSGDFTVSLPGTIASAVRTGTGNTTVNVAKYSVNPGTETFTGDIRSYLEVYVPDATGSDQIEIRLYYTDAEIAGLAESTLGLYWWMWSYNYSSGSWLRCSETGVNTGSNYIWARIRASGTTPDFSYLSGQGFGGGGTPAGAGGGGAPVFPSIYVGIAAALGAGIIAYFIHRRMASQKQQN